VWTSLAVENELQHLIGAKCGRVDEFVAAVGQDRMRIAASGDYLNRFGLDQPIFANRTHRNFVAAIGGSEQVTAGAIGRDIGHASGSGADAFCVSSPVAGSMT